jgi:hypothetical protein
LDAEGDGDRVISHQTGFDSAPLIPVGAVITDHYWTVPSNYSMGDRFPTKDLALFHAIEEMEAAVARHEAYYASIKVNGGKLPERIYVAYRWRITYNGGSVDSEIQRTEYPTIADAREALELYRRYSPVRPS